MVSERKVRTSQVSQVKYSQVKSIQLGQIQVGIFLGQNSEIVTYGVSHPFKY